MVAITGVGHGDRLPALRHLRPPRTDNIAKIADIFREFLDSLTNELTQEDRAKIDRMVQSGTFTPGTYRVDEPFTFPGRPPGD